MGPDLPLGTICITLSVSCVVGVCWEELAVADLLLSCWTVAVGYWTVAVGCWTVGSIWFGRLVGFFELSVDSFLVG